MTSELHREVGERCRVAKLVHTVHWSVEFEFRRKVTMTARAWRCCGMIIFDRALL